MNQDFSPQTRAENLQKLQMEPFDMLVIGGGITGCAIARDAAMRGYKVGLVERDDFASGTSSKSSKLIHGGLRYLESFEFSLVHEACRERRLLLRNAPHLVTPLPFVFPVHTTSPRPLWQIAIGMWLYDAMAVFRNIEAHQIWGAGRTLRREPLIGPNDLTGATYYFDAFDDDARLTIITAIGAHRAGAALANHASVISLLQSEQHVRGAVIRDEISGREFEAKAKVVINATGPWTDHLLGQSDPAMKKMMRPTKGVHLIMPRSRAASTSCITFTSPRDGRLMFLIPWGNFSIMGTTDTDYDQDPALVNTDSEDIAYILEAADNAFPIAKFSEADIISAYAGLRPLIANSAASSYKVSREHQIFMSKDGFLTIAGGKYTTHREMARQLVDQAAIYLQRTHKAMAHMKCVTAEAPLPGGEFKDRLRWQLAQIRASNDELSQPVMMHLLDYYGSDFQTVFPADHGSDAGQPIVPELPQIKAEIDYAVKHEMGMNLLDVLGRRLHIFDLDRQQGAGVAVSAAERMAPLLNWTETQKLAEIEHYRQAISFSRNWHKN